MNHAYAVFVQSNFKKRNVGDDGLVHAALGMSGEAGELVDAIKKTWVYGKPLDRENVVEELGDLLWYVQAACNLLGTTFEQCIAANIAKLEKRYPGGYTDALALARLDKVEAAGA